MYCCVLLCIVVYIAEVFLALHRWVRGGEGPSVGGSPQLAEWARRRPMAMACKQKIFLPAGQLAGPAASQPASWLAGSQPTKQHVRVHFLPPEADFRHDLAQFRRKYHAKRLRFARFLAILHAKRMRSARFFAISHAKRLRFAWYFHRN